MQITARTQNPRKDEPTQMLHGEISRSNFHSVD